MSRRKRYYPQTKHYHVIEISYDFTSREWNTPFSSFREAERFVHEQLRDFRGEGYRVTRIDYAPPMQGGHAFWDLFAPLSNDYYFDDRYIEIERCDMLGCAEELEIDRQMERGKTYYEAEAIAAEKFRI